MSRLTSLPVTVNVGLFLLAPNVGLRYTVMSEYPDVDVLMDVTPGGEHRKKKHEKCRGLRILCEKSLDDFCHGIKRETGMS